MLHFNQLSYWEKSAITEQIDFIVVGGGIVGIATALRIRELTPKAKIVLLERGYLSTGASTKNAGFACFGSVTELADDLSRMNKTAVWDTVSMRWRGLQRLRERFSDAVIDLKLKGSWDLITDRETDDLPELQHLLPYLNENISRITRNDNCFSYDTTIGKSSGFEHIHGGFHNRLEGEINTGKLFLASQQLLANAQIITLTGIEVSAIETNEKDVVLQTNFGELTAAKVAITVNGFAQQLLNDNRIRPARAQVIVSEEIPGFELPGTFHYQKGYYYFRSINNRLLFGGGRNLDFSGETTTEFATTETIIDSLKLLMKTVIFPGKEVKIDYQWAGIMGVGDEKKPIVECIHPNVGIGVRMGGMGVAIGSLVGEELAELIS